MKSLMTSIGSGLLVLASTTGCGDGHGGDEAADELATTGSEDTPASEDAFLVLSECDEADFAALPWSGPAFDPESGELVEPLAPPYVVASTVGWAKTDPESIERLGDLTGRIIEDALTRDGFLGGTFGSSEACGAARTLTLWRDERSMRDFALSGPHLEAIPLAAITMQSFGQVHWTETEQSAAPTWKTANARLLETRLR